MEYLRYYEIAHEGSRLFEDGDDDGALTQFLALMESDISDLDKAAMCQNIARVCEKQPHCCHLVAESRAAALFEHGRVAESLAAYESLLGLPWLNEAEKHRLNQNIAALRLQLAGAS